MFLYVHRLSYNFYFFSSFPILFSGTIRRSKLLPVLEPFVERKRQETMFYNSPKKKSCIKRSNRFILVFHGFLVGFLTSKNLP